MYQNRASGILLHPTSLPGPDGIGDLGPEAYRWIDFLHRSGCQLWQILPIGPTGYADSPYQCFSAFAGNPNLISAAVLFDQGLISKSDLSDRPHFPIESVDYGSVIQWKTTLLHRSFKRFLASENKSLYQEYDQFKINQQSWLNSYALFMAIKEEYGGGPWSDWPESLKKRNPKTLAGFIKKSKDSIDFQVYQQFIFYRQWTAVRKYAHQKGIRIIGDIPIFISYDSADVWEHKDLFHLDENALPRVVAGVPPDYFSDTGQLWGNPLYNWDVHKAGGYRWWLDRMKAVLSLVDFVRLDHFRGFEAYWEVPYENKTAIEGRWVKGPSEDLFKALQNELGELPIIAEDLGLITKPVRQLRDSFNLPGMKVLQFAFASDPDDDFLPHNYPVNCVAYTGTHDNDTSLGWYESAPEREKDFCRRYLARPSQDISWSFIRALWKSTAAWVIAPMQDFLGLRGWARMNYPGTTTGNWKWRMRPDALNEGLISRLHETNYLYGRLPEAEKQAIRNLMFDELKDLPLPH